MSLAGSSSRFIFQVQLPGSSSLTTYFSMEHSLTRPQNLHQNFINTEQNLFIKVFHSILLLPALFTFIFRGPRIYSFKDISPYILGEQNQSKTKVLGAEIKINDTGT